METDRPLADYPHVKQHLTIASIALILGLLFDYAFHDQDLGLSFPVFTAVALIGFSALAFHNKARLRPVQWAMVIGALIFAMSVYFRSSPFLVLVNTSVTVYLVSLLVWTTGGFRFLRASVGDYITHPFHVGVGSLDAGTDSISVLGTEAARSPRRREWLRLGRGVVLALPVLTLFIILFSAADLVFEETVAGMLDLVSLETWWRGVTVSFVTVAFLGLYVYAFLWEGQAQAEEAPGSLKSDMTIEASVILSLVSLLFFGFILVQFKYLFGGSAALALPGVTYAEYARQGFFELLGVTVLAFLTIWLMATRVWRRESGYPLHFKLLTVVLFGEVFVVIASALQRLLMYEEAFGFTTTRFYAHSAFYLIGFLTVALGLKIVAEMSDSGFLAAAFSISLLFLLGVNFVSPDRYVADKNIDRYQGAGDIDAAYLTTLSDDATPSIAMLPPLEPGKQKRLEIHLAERADRIESRRAQGWQSFRGADNLALAAIKEREDLAAFD